jgi:lysine 2,3-aminomutase
MINFLKKRSVSMTEVTASFQNRLRAKPPMPIEECEEEPPSSSPVQITHYPAAPLAKPGKIVRFPTHKTGVSNPFVRSFRKRFYPSVPAKLWNDWRWQASNRIRTVAQLETMIRLSEPELWALNNSDSKLPLGITPYYLSLVSEINPDQPLRRSVIPLPEELMKMPGEADDPLGEEHQSPVPGMVHRYPDRVLLLLSDFCSTFCRYCTRSRVVGHGSINPSRSRLEAAMEYIRSRREIRDVLLSGGDPLMIGDDKLDWILAQLRQIPHVEIIRIGTKVPAVLPQRITPQLVRILKKYHPLWMSLHFIHADECTPEAYRACALLADAGIPLGSQSVLLKGINDSVDTMKDLVHHLMKMRVRPYYLYQCDPITGSAHFRTSIEKGLEIIRGLRGYTSGYAVPTYVVDAPGGGGKIPLMPDYMAGRDNGDLLMRNYEDKLYRYPDGSCSK